MGVSMVSRGAPWKVGLPWELPRYATGSLGNCHPPRPYGSRLEAMVSHGVARDPMPHCRANLNPWRPIAIAMRTFRIPWRFPLDPMEPHGAPLGPPENSYATS